MASDIFACPDIPIYGLLAALYLSMFGYLSRPEFYLVVLYKTTSYNSEAALPFALENFYASYVGRKNLRAPRRLCLVAKCQRPLLGFLPVFFHSKPLHLPASPSRFMLSKKKLGRGTWVAIFYPNGLDVATYPCYQPAGPG